MATPAHCFYCFESLAASYDGNDPISLTAVEELWERYEQFKKLAALQEDDESPPLGGSEASGQQPGNASGQPDPRSHNIKLPSIDRLQTQAASDGSVSTTPSAMSNKSSSSVFSSATTSSSVSSESDTPAGRQHRLSEQKYPLFVTWNTLSKGGRKSLRGCIGTFEAQELSRGLKSYALTSAFDDTRFSPIPESLLPSLSCSLTLLGTFEPCTNALDWTLGIHGIRISFIHRGRRYGATYLPDVPVEQGWTKEETVKSLMHKAGWDGPSESNTRRFLRGNNSGEHTNSTKPWDQVSDFRTVKYQGLKSSASYAEWQEWRDWVLSLDDGSEQLLDPAD
ncbi:Putative AMMECR1 family protein (AFU_orthologue; AFUA_3G09390) [Aspergillus calidoustus]|uniref:Putative AMMECR1 family protein (AFU_orthologue AFUA_3G09390) n=1 Tax=Aspergillus calidoustus TaxID=454130 RepID=A0A0U5G7A6_ASPCI|nr:Putative AMMECR1 family protein (AFU_orthologue; AFUA_3G09390) [Aspergillus calidoustus]